MESQVVSWPRWYARYNDLRVSFFAAGQSAALSKDLLGLRAFSDNDVHRPSLHRSLIHHRDDLLRFSARRSNAARSLRWLLSPASVSRMAPPPPHPPPPSPLPPPPGFSTKSPEPNPRAGPGGTPQHPP